MLKIRGPRIHGSFNVEVAESPSHLYFLRRAKSSRVLNGSPPFSIPLPRPTHSTTVRSMHCVHYRTLENSSISGFFSQMRNHHPERAMQPVREEHDLSIYTSPEANSKTLEDRPNDCSASTTVRSHVQDPFRDESSQHHDLRDLRSSSMHFDNIASPRRESVI